MTISDLTKTRYENIYTYVEEQKTYFYVNFVLNGQRYQKKNFTKLFACNTLTQTRDKFEEVKTLIRKGEDPFSKNISKETIKNIVVEKINSRKSKYKDKDNTDYKKSLEVFYFKYIDDVIGHLKFENVKKSHIDTILKSMEHLSRGRKILLKVLLYEEFETRFRKREISENPLYKLTYGINDKKIKLSIRLNENLEKVAKQIYNNILASSLQTKLLLLINLMCARRIGEVYKLKYGDIQINGDEKVFVAAYPKITKTGIHEKYILPREVIELLPENIFNEEYREEPLFKFHINTVYLNYNKMIKESNIKLGNNFKITTHDNRNIFMTLLVKKGFDSELVDACLSHSKGEIKNVYLEVDDETKNKIFEKYWKILRKT